MELYPDRHGIAVHPFELDIPESRLSDNQRNINLHHFQWTRKMYGKQFLYFAFRNIETRQLHMKVDQHDWIHEEYDPPRMPTPIQAMNEIERARDAGERLRVRQPCKKMGRYALELITDETFEKCKASYDALKRRER